MYRKDFTSSVFIFTQTKEDVKTLLLHHNKLKKWMIAGGHIEFGENPAEAGVREAKEETGLDVELHSFIHQPVNNFLDAKWVLPPEYVFEELIPAYKDEEEHIHVDFLFIGLVQDSSNTQMQEEESSSIGWFTQDEIQSLDMFEMSQNICGALFEKVKQYYASQR